MWPRCSYSIVRLAARFDECRRQSHCESRQNLRRCLVEAKLCTLLDAISIGSFWEYTASTLRVKSPSCAATQHRDREQLFRSPSNRITFARRCSTCCGATFLPPARDDRVLLVSKVSLPRSNFPDVTGGEPTLVNGLRGLPRGHLVGTARQQLTICGDGAGLAAVL